MAEKAQGTLKFEKFYEETQYQYWYNYRSRKLRIEKSREY